MKRRAEALLAVALSLWLATGPAQPAQVETVPDPLSLKQALTYAQTHPRNRLDRDRQAWFPRRQPLYLDCHRLAYSSTSGIDNQRNVVSGSLITPVAAQQLEILQRFFDVLLADLSFSRYNESMAVAYIQFDRASARHELGQYSELRVAQLDAVYQDIRQRYLSSEASQRLTRSLLAQAINQPAALPSDLDAPHLPAIPQELPDLDEIIAAASTRNTWLTALKDGGDQAEHQLIELELRQQILELLLRIQVLGAAQRSAQAETLWRDLELEESRTLYELEVKADLGYSMSQQTRAHLKQQQVAYCQALAWAELNALQGKAPWTQTTTGD